VVVEKDDEPVIVVNAGQSSNASIAITRRCSGKSIEIKDEQRAKALSPIAVVVGGISSDVNDAHI